MPREMTDEAREQIERLHNYAVEVVEFAFHDETVRVALGSQTIVWTPPPPPGFFVGVGGSPIGGPHTWHAMGGRVARGTIRESLDFDGQGTELQFSAVDPDFEVIGRLLTDTQFAAKLSVWRLWFHESGPDAGKVAASLRLHRGYLNGAVEVREERAEGARPGQLEVTIRSVSPLAHIEIKRGIATNLASHQRWLPGDLGFEFVPKIMNRKTYFGTDAPSTSTAGR